MINQNNLLRESYEENRKRESEINFRRAMVVAWFVFSIATNSGIGTAQSITSKIEGAESCTLRWFCSNWIPVNCTENGIQKRTCTNAGDCADDYKKPSEKRGCEPKIPAHLFDIKLELEDRVVYRSSDLKAWVRFENFGTEPTRIELNYTILDEQESTVFSVKAFAVVETEKFIVEKFEGLRLSPGKYILILNTLYNINIEDEFKKEFEVKDPRGIFNRFIFVFSVLIVIFLVARLTKIYWKIPKKRGKTKSEKW